MSRLTSPHKFGPIPSLIGKIRNLSRHNTWNKIPLFILPSLALSSISIYFLSDTSPAIQVTPFYR